jgi:hypothetical protein
MDVRIDMPQDNDLEGVLGMQDGCFARICGGEKDACSKPYTVCRAILLMNQSPVGVDNGFDRENGHWFRTAFLSE